MMKSLIALVWNSGRENACLVKLSFVKLSPRPSHKTFPDSLSWTCANVFDINGTYVSSLVQSRFQPQEMPFLLISFSVSGLSLQGLCLSISDLLRMCMLDTPQTYTEAQNTCSNGDHIGIPVTLDTVITFSFSTWHDGAMSIIYHAIE